jgi:hypothetical protein
MALISLQNAIILAGPTNLTGFTNMVDLTSEAEEKDVTTFGSAGFKSVLNGLRQTSVKVEGFWEAGGAGFPDDRLFGDLGTTGVPMTVAPTPTVGETSYFTKVARLSYTLGAEVGEVAPFSSEAQSDGTVLVRGQIADNSVRSTTGTTAVRTLTAPTANQRVYAAIHVTAVTGTPTLTATLQGDDAIGFPSPASVAVGTGITAVGSQWLQGPAGVTADSFYRLSYVVSGTGTLTVVASIGVG